MNIANVTARFLVLSGLELSELEKWRFLIDDACRFIGKRLVKKSFSAQESERIDMLCAVHALRLFSICSDSIPESFVAGDVHITSSASAQKRAEELWRLYAKQSEDIIGADSFYLGAVRS